ncbi:MAG: trypsin-like peptidase domain-containing protein, partial [Kiritimatiellales bacterium]|nr:trypsin-like peptidase domain-containing protein [Kiritimatiellales bacterium]
FNDISDHLVIISCKGPGGRSSGSGFIARMDGKTYLFTNQHVIMGADKISFKTATGNVLRPRSVELSTTRDIARLLLAEEDGLEVTRNLSMGVPIAVFGNSEGGGVATQLYGEITGVGADVVEVSAEFVKGNSGSPVLNLGKEVVGIASFVRYSRKKKDTEGTRFENQTRRFCYRLTDMEWTTVNWKQYNKRYGKLYRTNEEMTESIFEIIEQWSSDPFGRVGDEDNAEMSLRRWSNAHNLMVNRIVRLSDKGRASQHELDNTNKQIRKDVSDSADALSKVCKKRARQMRMLADQRDLTGFLREEFEDYGDSLEFAGEIIDRIGDKLSTLNYFRFSKEK